MDNGPPLEAEFHSESSVDGHDPLNDRYTGAFFPGAQNFVIAGGNFKSTTKITHATPPVPADFRTIPMGDLDLRHEIRLASGSGVVNRWQRRPSVRRVYSARIPGFKAKMTVAVYQGENAEKEWQEDISRYSFLLHPNIVQLYATASRSGIHAAVFHDELIPATQILKESRGSQLSTVYLYHYLDTEFEDAQQYMKSVLERRLHSLDCMMWIRCSTGRLCIDLTHPTSGLLLFNSTASSSSAPSSTEPPDDSQIIESTPLSVYHGICSLHLGHCRQLPISPDASVQLGAIISCAAGTGIEYSTMIGGLPENMFHDDGWSGTCTELLVMADGWTRVISSDIGREPIKHTIVSQDFLLLQFKAWLAQANYIFSRLGITSYYDNYVCVRQIQYQLTLFATGRMPPGYLFLCPLRDFESRLPSQFWLPKCPAYWSLDPTGAKRLSTEEADELGFPSLEFKMDVWGYSWDESVYTGIRQFHEGKGYDPYSQDVARELGFPLFQVASELGLFQDTGSCSGDEDSDRPPRNEVNGEPGEDSLLVKRIHPFLDQAELLEPSKTGKMVMGLQFILILTSSVLSLMSYFLLLPTSLNT